ncbi:hypothetical protein SNEBB_009556 [Seison nebaliae]|nr:hypothetical protein SNEBB_009556 [Seison nebaliae]
MATSNFLTTTNNNKFSMSTNGHMKNIVFLSCNHNLRRSNLMWYETLSKKNNGTSSLEDRRLTYHIQTNSKFNEERKLDLLPVAKGSFLIVNGRQVNRSETKVEKIEKSNSIDSSNNIMQSSIMSLISINQLKTENSNHLSRINTILLNLMYDYEITNFRNSLTMTSHLFSLITINIKLLDIKAIRYRNAIICGERVKALKIYFEQVLDTMTFEKFTAWCQSVLFREGQLDSLNLLPTVIARQMNNYTCWDTLGNLIKSYKGIFKYVVKNCWEFDEHSQKFQSYVTNSHRLRYYKTLNEFYHQMKIFSDLTPIDHNEAEQLNRNKLEKIGKLESGGGDGEKSGGKNLSYIYKLIEQSTLNYLKNEDDDKELRHDISKTKLI